MPNAGEPVLLLSDIHGLSTSGSVAAGEQVVLYSDSLGRGRSSSPAAGTPVLLDSERLAQFGAGPQLVIDDFERGNLDPWNIQQGNFEVVNSPFGSGNLLRMDVDTDSSGRMNSSSGLDNYPAPNTRFQFFIGFGGFGPSTVISWPVGTGNDGIGIHNSTREGLIELNVDFPDVQLDVVDVNWDDYYGELLREVVTWEVEDGISTITVDIYDSRGNTVGTLNGSTSAYTEEGAIEITYGADDDNVVWYDDIVIIEEL